MGRVLSVNHAVPEASNAKTVGITGINKCPVDGPVLVRQATYGRIRCATLQTKMGNRCGSSGSRVTLGPVPVARWWKG